MALLRRCAFLPLVLSVLALVGVSRLEDDGDDVDLLHPRWAHKRGGVGMDFHAEDLSEWWMPMLSPVEASDLDHHLCGIGLQLGYGFFLAHTRAVNRIYELAQWSRSAASMFLTKPPTSIDLAQPLPRDIFVPRHVLSYAGGIALYQAVHRAGVPRNAPSFSQAHPMNTRLFLEYNINARPTDGCSIMTYGDDYLGPEPSTCGLRRLKLIGVKERHCNGPICEMITVHRGPLAGRLCGVYSALGSPIICGDGSAQKVRYIVSDVMREYGPAGGCFFRFRALKAAHVCDNTEELRNRQSGQLTQCL